MKLNKYTLTAIESAKTAGEILKKYFNSSIKVGFKGRIDPVTIADKTSQKAIFKILKKEFPSHSIIGEESKKVQKLSEYSWIVDPLDGTVNFIHGYPVFSVSIALYHKNEVISGVVYAPLLKEMFVAEKSKGAYLNNTKIHASKVSDTVRSLVVTGFPYDLMSKSSKIVKSFKNVLTEVQGVRRLGSAALDLAYVAMGRFDAFWEEGLNPWDVAAGALLVKEAGGTITDYKNGTDYIFGKNLVSSNGLIHKDMLKLLK